MSTKLFSSITTSYWYVSSNYKNGIQGYYKLKTEPVRFSRSCLVRTQILAITGKMPKIRKKDVTFLRNIEKTWFFLLWASFWRPERLYVCKFEFQKNITWFEVIKKNPVEICFREALFPTLVKAKNQNQNYEKDAQ